MADTTKTGSATPTVDRGLDWNADDRYWETNYATRPYIGTNRDYAQWKPAYRYGHEMANRYRGRQWNEIESDMRTGWDRYEHRGTIQSTWEQVKDAVRDAWDRVTGNR
jgi:hypothetical protein